MCVKGFPVNSAKVRAVPVGVHSWWVSIPVVMLIGEVVRGTMSVDLNSLPQQPTSLFLMLVVGQANQFFWPEPRE